MNGLIKLIVVLALLIASSQSWASLYRLDFGGESDSGSFSGYFIFDYTTVDADPDPTRGFFPGLVTSLNIVFDGVRYTMEGPGPIISGTANSPEGSIGDYFGVGGGVSNSDGDLGFFAIQFQDLDGDIFSSDALPTTLDLADFDSFDINNSFSTGVIASFLSGDDFVPLDFIEFRQVPVPAAVWLFLSALLSFSFRRQ